MSAVPLYSLRPSEVYVEFDTSPEGLSSGEAEARLSLFGPNTLPEPDALPLWRKIIEHFTHPMALVLGGAGLLAWLAGHPTLLWIIWFVVGLNAAFSFWQEYRAEQAVSALADVLPNMARVLRDGEEVLVPAPEIVPGDMLVLEQGNNIPADARVVKQYGLRTNQAVLTGEAMAALKTESASFNENLTELERPNLLFMGSSIVSGTGYAVVYATGGQTQFGRIARLTQSPEEAVSPLECEINRLTRILSIMAVAVAATMFGVGVTDVGISSKEAFILAIGILVATLPEGLRPTLTLSLAVAVQRLAHNGVLIKKLAMVETLGKVSVVCTDKSGTLTYNQMTVKELWVGGRELQVTGAGYQPEGSINVPGGGEPPEELTALLTAAALCNNARLLPPSDEYPRWSALGDQTEAALRACALKSSLTEAKLEEAYPRIHELPFEASRKRMSTIHRNGRGEIAFVKGVPADILNRSTHILLDGEPRPLTSALRQEIEEVIDRYARRTLRVLAVAQRELPPREGAYTPETVERDLVFLGLTAMMDPPRTEVAAAMKTLRRAGIRVVMITGDYGLTAESLATRVGVVTTSHVRTVTGSDIDRMSSEELEAVAQEDGVLFARVAPEHKLRVVGAFQSLGHTVAVIGDGVNDGPALRKANVGVAMGKAGTDVAREAADIILTNDDFSAIVHAVEEGRAVVRNIRKFITYILASNVPEVLPFVLSALFDWPLALTVVQILAIDLGTDLLPALALGTERPEPDIMSSYPQAHQQPLIDQGLVSRAFWLGGIEVVLCYIGFFAVLGAVDAAILPDSTVSHWLSALPEWPSSPGNAPALARTVFFAGVITAQVGNALAGRRERPGVHELGWLSNRFLLVGLAFEVLLALVLIYVKPLAGLFEHQSLPYMFWIGLALYPFALYGLDRLRKEWVWRFGHRAQEQKESL